MWKFVCTVGRSQSNFNSLLSCRKFGALEVAYHQLRQTGRGSYEFSGEAETVGEEEESESQERPAKGGMYWKVH